MPEAFRGAKDLAQAMCDMSELEAKLEKMRRELALRTDFNMTDAYKMFNRSSAFKKGIDCDDFFHALVYGLGLAITKDEMFILFYKLDKDGDGKLCFSEVCDCFVPKDPEYQTIVNTRGGFYGGETNTSKYFAGPTRQSIKDFLRAYIDAEVSIELIRQRVVNKLGVKPDLAFNVCDKDKKGYIIMDDMREFLKSTNMYPSEKNMQLLYSRFDRDEDQIVTYEEFVTALTPFKDE